MVVVGCLHIPCASRPLDGIMVYELRGSLKGSTMVTRLYCLCISNANAFMRLTAGFSDGSKTIVYVAVRSPLLHYGRSN